MLVIKQLMDLNTEFILFVFPLYKIILMGVLKK
jgi:hypothetical protein